MSLIRREEQILIKVFTHRDSSSKVPLHLMIQLPEQMEVKVETENASVLMQDYPRGSGNCFHCWRHNGRTYTRQLTLRSNRGNIIVRESSGDISVVGNYGALTVQNVSGETAVSTIMGNIVFDGLIEAR